MIAAGTAVVEITPPAGLAMSGFAARTEPAQGAHDPLTARALVVGDTAIVVADVIGFHHEMSVRIRARSSLPDNNIIVAATHTHGGPVSMRNRLSVAADESYLQRLEDACVEALDKAAAARRPASLSIGAGVDPDIARNRRHADGLVDRSLPVLRVRDVDGQLLAVMTCYACHPVVLGADNRLWTGDYPHFVRTAIEREEPGATALFLTGCCGDANTGHSPHASVNLAADPARSFPEATRIGEHIARCAATAGERALGSYAHAASVDIELSLAKRETESVAALAERWHHESPTASLPRKNLLGYWIEWARAIAIAPLSPLPARVTMLDWGGCSIVAMPGEIFAETALAIRKAIPAGDEAFVLAFCEDNPGYLPPESEFAPGGYEVDEAHRFYGQPATFAPGSAERIVRQASGLQAALRKKFEISRIFCRFA